MTVWAKSLLDSFMHASRLELLPVRVRSGIAAGARWSLYPLSSYWRGTHEPALQATLLSADDWTGKACWDLGAHFGIYSVGLARAVGPTGQVAAFEPNPLSYRRLDYHRRLNRLDWLLTFPVAVSDRKGVAELYTYGTLRGTTTHLPYEGETSGPPTRPVSIRTVVLDELVHDGSLRAPHFIKVDVEGHAHRALAGARTVIADQRPLLIVALHSPQEVEGVLTLLQPLGYRISVIGGSLGADGRLEGRDVLFRPA